MKKKTRKYILIGTVTIVLVILSFFMYQSYAYYKVNYTGNIINTNVASFTSCANCGILKVSDNNPGETSKFLNSPSPIVRNMIESIKFADHKTIPGTALGSWDVSAAEDNSVIAWYENIDGDSRYEVTIGSLGGVKGNVNSTWLFQNMYYLESIDLTHFYTHEVIIMDAMMASAGRYIPVFTLTLGNNFDTSNVTSMIGVFYYTGEANPNFTLDLGNKFDTSKVIDMRQMFEHTGYSNPNFILDLRQFTLVQVTSAYKMLTTEKTTHKIYAKDTTDAVWIANGKGFTGTIINCTTNPISCP